MSDARKRLQDALARQDESYEDRQAREARERAAAVAYFEQTIVPAFQAAADEINQQAAAHTRAGQPPPDAEARQGTGSHDLVSMELTVRRGGRAEFWFRGMARMRVSPIQWTYRRNPRIKNDKTLTFEGTDRELKWNVSVGAWTPEQVTDDLLARYAEVVEARTRQMRR